MSIGVHGDNGDAGPVIDPTLLEDPAVGEPHVALIDIENAAMVYEGAVEFSCVRHDGFLPVSLPIDGGGRGGGAG
jgi:hypothetical protein